MSKAKYLIHHERQPDEDWNPGDWIHMDIQIKKPVSPSGHIRYLMIKDHTSAIIWKYNLLTKDQASDYTIKWLKGYHAQHGHWIKKAQVDYSGKFKAFKLFTKDKGINYTASAPQTPKQNK